MSFCSTLSQLYSAVQNSLSNEQLTVTEATLQKVLEVAHQKPLVLNFLIFTVPITILCHQLMYFAVIVDWLLEYAQES